MGLGKTYSTKYLLDSNNSSGVAGQVLSTTSTGIDWADANTLPGSGLWLENGNDIYNSNSGNVGIGMTTAPDEKLDVAGNVQVTGTSVTVVNASDPSVAVSSTDSNYKGLMVWRNSGSENVLEFVTRYGGTYYTNNLVLDRGNVGIGTDDPDDKLEVNGGNIRITHNSPILRFIDTDVTDLQHRVLGGGNAGLEYSADVNNVASGYHRWDISNSEKMRLIESGNLGIGATGPNANLQVERNTSTPNLFDFYDIVANIGNLNSNPGNHYSSGVRIYQGSGTMGNGLAALNIGVSTNAAVPASKNTATLETPNGMTGGLKLNTRDSSATIRFFTDSAERMVISSAGLMKFTNYGAGTLVTDASGNITAAPAGPGNVGYLPLSAGSGYPLTGNLFINNGFTLSWGADTTKIAGNSSTNELSLITASTTRIRIDSAGNVGIGVTGPGEKLEIDGNIRIYNSSNAPYIDFTESGAVTDSKARITMDQIDTDNGTLIFSTENAGTLTTALTISQTQTATFANTVKASTYLINLTSAAGIGASLGDINGSELGPGYLTVSRDDTADAKQITFYKNNVEHSYLETTTSGLNIGGAQVNISQKPNSGLAYDVLINLGTSPDGLIGYQTIDQLAANLGASTSSNWVKSGNDIYNSNSGNVGIGTTTVNSKLEIYSTATFDPRTSGINIHRPGAFGQYCSIAYNVNETVISSTYTGTGATDYGSIKFQQFNNGTVPRVVMYLNTAGNVGIGTTTNISSPLTIQTDASAGALSIIGRNNGTNDEAVISFYEYDGTTRNAYIIKEAGNLAFATGTGGSASERMRIDSAGNVIIGATSTPFIYGGKTLHVGGSRATLALKSTGSLSTFVMSASNSINTTDIHLNQSGADGSLSFYQYSNGGTSMTLDGSGNLGIGITGPTKKLDVIDTINGAYGTSTQQTVARFFNKANDATINSAFINLQCSSDNEASNPVAAIGVVSEGTSSNNGSFVAATRSSGGIIERLRINSAGAIKFNAYGAGTLVTDASGNITASSGGGAGGPYLPLTGGTVSGPAATGAYLVTIENTSGSTATSYGLLVKGGGGSASGKTFEVQDSSGNSDFIVKGNGEIGIGITTPGTLHGASYGTTKLHIDGGTDRGQLIIEGDSFAGIVLSDNGATANERVFATSVDEGKYSIKPINDNGTSTAGGVAVTVEHGGNVGIGTTDPQGKLDVAADSSTASAIKTLVLGGGTGVNGNGQYIQFRSSANVTLGSQIAGTRVAAGAASDLRFSTTDSSSVVRERMHITSDGSVLFSSIVGINITTTPTEKLDVNGNIKLRGSLILEAGSDVIVEDFPASGAGGGTVVYWPVSTTTTVGQIYAVKTNGGWSDVTSADSTATKMIALASNTPSTNGMLLQGFFYKASHGFSIGDPLYIGGTQGVITNTAPTTTGHFVRIIGYATSVNHIYFDPDKTWIELT